MARTAKEKVVGKSGAGKLFQYPIVVIFTFFENLGIAVFLFVKFYGRDFLPDNLNFFLTFAQDNSE